MYSNGGSGRVIWLLALVEYQTLSGLDGYTGFG